jgi:hypothetical protein
VNGPPVLWDSSTKGQKECHFRGVDCAATAYSHDAIRIQWRQECRSRKNIRLAWILMDVGKYATHCTRRKRIKRMRHICCGYQVWIDKQRDTAMAGSNGAQG